MLALILYIKFIDNYTILKFIFSLCCSLYFAFKLNLLQNSFRKCPDCYGNELCRFFQNQQIQLTWFSFLLSVINPSITKSVFYGIFNETVVVIKRKVGRNKELVDYKVRLSTDEPQSVILCPSVDDVGFLFDQIEGGVEKKKLWMDLSSSIEPLLLMYFQNQGSWPFPKYYGACGDVIVAEHKGEPLTNFLSAEYKKRMFLASNLIKMAKLFTFGHPHLAFYFTDYSLDNLVVDSNGNIFLIDLDNVIISNKSAIKGSYPAAKQSFHNSEILDEYEYAFSPTDICQHYLSDHNYFSVCKYILSHPKDGLLKKSSLDVEKYEKLLWLLEECSHPKQKSDRFTAGQDVQDLLDEILNDYKYS